MYPPTTLQGLLIRGLERKEYLDLDKPSEVINAEQLYVGVPVMPFPSVLRLDEVIDMAQRMEELDSPLILARKRKELVFQIILPLRITPVMLRRQLCLAVIASDAERLLKNPGKMEVMIPLMDLPALSEAAVELGPYPLRLSGMCLYLDLPHTLLPGEYHILERAWADLLPLIEKKLFPWDMLAVCRLVLI